VSKLHVEEKIGVYGKPVKRLRFYMDVFVRAEAALFVLAALITMFRYEDYGFLYCLSTTALAAWGVLAALTVQDLERSAFYINFSWLIAWPVIQTLMLAIHLLPAWVLLSSLIPAVESAGGSASDLQILGAELVGSAFGDLIKLLVTIALCIYFARGLWRDRALFFKDIEELRI
jgi:hypothetical protein